MRKLFFFATVLIALASCSNDEFVGDKTKGEDVGNIPISFAFDVPAATRAAGATAAGLLNNQFIVWGEKNESGKNAPTDGNLVFPNYKVTYGANSAYSTTSNTMDWEYVGSGWTATQAGSIQMNSTAVTTNDQTIKYWDYAASSYTFTAVSANPEDIANGRVVIDKLTSGTSTEYDKGYTVTLSKTAGSGGTSDTYPSLSDLYFSDRNEIGQGTGKDRTAKDAYGGNVTFNFRNSLTQVRAGVYETVPGYSVTAIKFYVTSNAEAKSGSISAFGAIAPNVGTNFEGTLTVTYYDATDADTKNHPKLTFSGTTPANDLILGTNMSMLSTSKTLGISAASPTWDTDGGTFTSVLPQIDNTTNMKLKVDYTLWNDVSKETIRITGKTVEVPAKYLAWKPNFKYTYLFKITDDDLYPITFDAVVVEAEDGQAEYITTVTEPSITTFGVKNNVYSVGKNEYESATDIYATIVDGSAVINPDGKYNVYKVTTTGIAITEASVAESLAEVSAKTHKVTCDAYTGTTPTLVTTVPGEDGNDITLPAGKAIKLANVATGTYAIEYVKTARTYKYVAVPIANAEAFTAAKAALNLFKDNTGTNAVADSDTYNASAKYYKKVVDNVGDYTYKVINVVAAP
ncbi:MAG: hypothetical protein IJ901_01870 [Bacteroidaceae bacterium]|nr:hypothetical protein [Bacteroidaceae bacterium]